MIAPADGWRPLTEPGLVAEKAVGRGRLIAVTLPPTGLPGRAGVKAGRVWHALLTNLGATPEAIVAGDGVDVSEALPGYINW